MGACPGRGRGYLGHAPRLEFPGHAPGSTRRAPRDVTAARYKEPRGPRGSPGNGAAGAGPALARSLERSVARSLVRSAAAVGRAVGAAAALRLPPRRTLAPSHSPLSALTRRGMRAPPAAGTQVNRLEGKCLEGARARVFGGILVASPKRCGGTPPVEDLGASRALSLPSPGFLGRSELLPGLPGLALCLLLVGWPALPCSLEGTVVAPWRSMPARARGT